MFKRHELSQNLAVMQSLSIFSSCKSHLRRKY